MTHCPDCEEPLQHTDTLGNLDHCLDAIGHPRDPHSRPRTPVKTGDVWHCEPCGKTFHTIDGCDAVFRGYPC